MSAPYRIPIDPEGTAPVAAAHRANAGTLTSPSGSLLGRAIEPPWTARLLERGHGHVASLSDAAWHDVATRTALKQKPSDRSCLRRFPHHRARILMSGPFFFSRRPVERIWRARVRLIWPPVHARNQLCNENRIVSGIQ